MKQEGMFHFDERKHSLKLINGLYQLVKDKMEAGCVIVRGKWIQSVREGAKRLDISLVMSTRDHETALMASAHQIKYNYLCSSNAPNSSTRARILKHSHCTSVSDIQTGGVRFLLVCF